MAAVPVASLEEFITGESRKRSYPCQSAPGTRIASEREKREPSKSLSATLTVTGCRNIAAPLQEVTASRHALVTAEEMRRRTSSGRPERRSATGFAKSTEGTA